MKYATVLLLITSLLTFSCNVQKRVHRGGFHLSGIQHKKDKKRSNYQSDSPQRAIAKTIEFKESASENGLGFTEKPGDTCDQIILTSGEVISVKVIEFIYTNVRYKLCDEPNRPTQLTSTKDIFLINYADGRTEKMSDLELEEVPEIIQEEEEVKDVEETPSSKQNNNCDNIITKSGESIHGKVIEIRPSEIVYKACDNLEGPNILVSKSSVLVIKYSNGKNESFASLPEVQPVATNNPEISVIKDPRLRRERRRDGGGFRITSLSTLVMGLGSFLWAYNVSSFYENSLLATAFGFFALSIIFSAISSYRAKKRSASPASKAKSILLLTLSIFGLVTVVLFSIFLF